MRNVQVYGIYRTGIRYIPYAAKRYVLRRDSEIPIHLLLIKGLISYRVLHPKVLGYQKIASAHFLVVRRPVSVPVLS